VHMSDKKRVQCLLQVPHRQCDRVISFFIAPLRAQTPRGSGTCKRLTSAVCRGPSALVADHTHEEIPAKRPHGRGPVPFCPSQVSVLLIYLPVLVSGRATPTEQYISILSQACVCESECERCLLWAETTVVSKGYERDEHCSRPVAPASIAQITRHSCADARDATASDAGPGARDAVREGKQGEESTVV